MKLKADSGDAFELVVLRYEFPDITEDWWESNWLVVRGRVSAGEREWEFVEPCVTTFELAGLVEWLTAIDDGRNAREYVFTEPHLGFAYLDTPEPRLRVRFAHGSAPPWFPEFAKRTGFNLEFPASEREAVIAGLRRALDEFPIRGGAA